MEAQREKARAGKVGLVGAQLNRHGSDPAVLGAVAFANGAGPVAPQFPVAGWLTGTERSRLASIGAPAWRRVLG